MFKKILIANRGEIACRVTRTAKTFGYRTVAVFSDADAGALHVRQADEAVRIGPPPAQESYLNIEALLAAAKLAGADAVHPGYGFLSENAAFAEACTKAGLIFIGPPAAAIDAMGNKARAKALMEAAGVPVVPGYRGADQSDETLIVEGRRIGFPLMVKAAAGGGGRGMRLVGAAAELDDAYARASAEASAAFSDGTLYVEKAIAPARHVEIQVLCDSFGGVLTCGERECSIQRRHQKLIEESPSPALDAALREEMESAAERACRHIGYRNAGTFEFLVGPDGSFSFIELNARLQVEHPVTEMVTSLDIVREQIRIAAGERLALIGRAPRAGHAIEIRINAEDPSRGFAPAPGILGRFRPPLGPGVRVDTFVEDGASIPPHYDSLIAKVIVCDDTRDAAIARALRSLGELDVLGVPTTREAALEIIASDEFRSGEYSTSFLEEAGARLPALAGAAR
jgi:geranyl-CoA carboxylase alpha subunit